ncbi:unnamed protein product [Adineta ricciae]|uniref:G-protein coupled receptors family 1 profile domain-containing protein n=1 Tax=Adineta ricciae TaxID=249248 RepID=A0A815M7H4_ADIRI|nr:unnamed protein product [Adineta ricciae]CAF1417766.1 unnamed protein product [Adineta ricciae]
MSSSAELIRCITLYVGLPVFSIGTVGNLLNIRYLWRTRNNPCAFLFLVGSIVNCIVLFYGLLTRILSVGFNLDWSTTNVGWCKTRIAFTQASFLISLTCVCLASFDRLFSSCRQEKYRRLSRLSLARISVLLTTVLWLGHSVPYLVYAELISNSNTDSVSCSLLPNKSYATYRTYVALPLYLGVFPAMILIVTGILTYRNTNHLRQGQQRQLIQKQLTTVMLLQTPCILLSTSPYVVFTVYLTLTTAVVKSADVKSMENILSSVFTLIFYFAFSCQFFIFYISTKSFREEMKNFILHKRTNRVRPIS